MMRFDRQESDKGHVHIRLLACPVSVRKTQRHLSLADRLTGMQDTQYTVYTK